jgi:hypothetical protein
MRCENCGSDLVAQWGTCDECGSLTLSVCLSPRSCIEFGLAIALGFSSLGAMGVLLGRWPLAEIVWLGANLGEVVTVLGAIALTVPAPALFVTSLVALRQLERARMLVTRRAQAQAQAASALRAAVDPPFRLTPTQRFALAPPPSVAEHTTLRLAVGVSRADHVMPSGEA